MKTKEYNKGVSFLVPYVSYAQLCRAISRVPGVVFMKRPRFFWPGENIRAEFRSEGKFFTIDVDPWEAGLWVTTKDSRAYYAEIERLRNAVENHITPLGALTGFISRAFARTLSAKSRILN